MSLTDWLVDDEDDDISQDEIPTVMYDDSYSYLLDEGTLSESGGSESGIGETQDVTSPRRTLRARVKTTLARLWACVVDF